MYSFLLLLIYRIFTVFLNLFPQLKNTVLYRIWREKWCTRNISYLLELTVVIFTVSTNTNFQLKDSDVNRDCVSWSINNLLNLFIHDNMKIFLLLESTKIIEILT